MRVSLQLTPLPQVNEVVPEGVVPGRAGCIVTQIGQLAELRELLLFNNRLTGACHFFALLGLAACGEGVSALRVFCLNARRQAASPPRLGSSPS